jgi:hypothetical protein
VRAWCSPCVPDRRPAFRTASATQSAWLNPVGLPLVTDAQTTRPIPEADPARPPPVDAASASRSHRSGRLCCLASAREGLPGCPARGQQPILT